MSLVPRIPQAGTNSSVMTLKPAVWTGPLYRAWNYQWLPQIIVRRAGSLQGAGVQGWGGSKPGRARALPLRGVAAVAGQGAAPALPAPGPGQPAAARRHPRASLAWP